MSSGKGRPSCLGLNVLTAGYRLSWDNMQVHEEVRHQGTGARNKALLWVNRYAAKDTVNVTSLSSTGEKSTLEIPTELLMQNKLL